MQYRLVRSENQCIVAVVFVERVFVGEQELVEDAGRHQDGLAGSHRKGVNVVRIPSRILLHSLVKAFELNLGSDLEKRTLRAIKTNVRTILEYSSPFEPFSEELMYRSVTTELLDEDVHFQRLELRDSQIGVVFLRVVKIQKLFRQILVVAANMPAVIDVEIPKRAEERKFEADLCLLLCHS